MSFNYNIIVKKVKSFKNIVLKKEKKSIHSVYLDLKNEFISLENNNIENNLLKQLNKIYSLINGKGILSEDEKNLIIKEIDILLNILDKYLLDYNNKIQTEKLHSLKERNKQIQDDIKNYNGKKRNMLSIFLYSILFCAGITVGLPVVLGTILGAWQNIHIINGMNVPGPFVASIVLAQPMIAATAIVDVFYMINNHKMNKKIKNLKNELDKSNVSINNLEQQIEKDKQKTKDIEIKYKNTNVHSLENSKYDDDNNKLMNININKQIKLLDQAKNELMVYDNNVKESNKTL